jgi:hypothetical protein
MVEGKENSDIFQIFSVVNLLGNLQFCNEFPTNFPHGELGVVSCDSIQVFQ